MEFRVIGEVSQLKLPEASVFKKVLRFPTAVGRVRV